MFDGSAVEKRSVNLGGRRRDNASASELARRARVERAARAAEAKRLRSAQTLQRWYRGRRVAKTWRAELRRNFDARVQDLERVRAALAAQNVPFAPPEAVAATLVAGFVAFDSGAADATRLESACALFQGCASNPPSRARGVIQSCVAALERGDAVGAGVQSALNALQDPILLVEVGPRCCAIRDSVIASRVAAAAVRIRGDGPRADACRAAYLHLLASTPRTRRLDAPLLEEGALRRACDALTSKADARILAVLMDLAPKAPSDAALPSSVARAASMLVQTLPIEIQGEKMDDSSDSDDDDARRGTLLLADALSDAFAARDRRAPRGSIDLARVARPFCAWLCDKATTSSEAAKAAASFGSAVLARCSTAQALLGKATAQPLLAEAVLDAAAFSRERGAVVRALFAEVDNSEDALFLFASSFALLLRALDDAALAAGWSGDDLRGIVSLLSKFLRRELWDEPILQKEPDAKRLATVAVCARLFSQLRDRVARQLDDDALWLWDGVRAASVETQAPPPPSLMEDDEDDTMDVDGDLPWARRQTPQPMPSERPPLHASLEPRVAQTLAACPFVVGFQQRVALFQGRVEKDRQQRQSDAGFDMSMRPLGFRVKVRRDQIFEDSFRQLHKLSSDQLKGRVQVTFISETGQEEAGIDGGGVFKEFLDQLTKAAFGSSGLFKASPTTGLLYASGSSDLARYEFCGRIIGKALYEGVLVEPRFARFFLNKALGKYNYFDDLRSLDGDLYGNLVRLKHMNPSEVDALDLSFAITVNGKDIPLSDTETKVTSKNRSRYVQLVAHHRLNVEPAKPCAAFLKGLRAVIDATWLRAFDPDELQVLVSGADVSVDVTDWQRHTHYGGGYHPSQPFIRWFWEVVSEFDDHDRAALLKFVTACSRPPLLGFRMLSPSISIHQVSIHADDDRLPTAGTCMNLLKLPRYTSKEVLREKLRYSIHNGVGFELS